MLAKLPISNQNKISTNIRNLLLCYSDKVGVLSFSPRFRYKIPKIARDVFIISSLDSLLDACFRGPEKCCITGNTGQSEGCGAQHQTLVDLKKEGVCGIPEYPLQGGNVGNY